ncbi:MAG: NAD-binding protein [Treponemataceae bacterium]
MKIVIVGAGFTGLQLAKILVNERNDVVLIDNSGEVTKSAENSIDCSVIFASGNSLQTLEQAGISKADAMICVTNSDEVNMITCSMVDAVYPDVLKIARVRNYTYYLNSEKFERKPGERPIYGIDYMIHPDVEAAAAIVGAYENGAVSDVLTFDQSSLQITRIPITENSVFAGHKLMELRNITPIKMLVAYFEFDGKTCLPDGNTIMMPGYNLGVLLAKEDLNAVLELSGSKQKDFKKIVLFGAGRIGTIVAERIIDPKNTSIVKRLGEKFLKRKQDFVIIDNDEELATAASEKFPNANVFKADGTDENFLLEERINEYDLAICASHNHELNMILSAFLESLGVKQTISLVSSSAFGSIAKKLGIDVAIPLRDVIVDSIMSHLRGSAVKEVHTINDGNLEIIECEISSASKVCGKSTKEIAQPGKFLILLKRSNDEESYQIVNGDTAFSGGDHIVFIALSECSTKVLELFGNTEI